MKYFPDSWPKADLVERVEPVAEVVKAFPKGLYSMNGAQKAVLAYNEQQPPVPAVDFHEQMRQVFVGQAEARRKQVAEAEKWLKYKEERERARDAADVALTNLLAKSTSLWAVTKARYVSDDYDSFEFVIPLAVFESESEAKAACATFSQARAHDDSDEFEVKPMPFFKKGGAS